MLKLRVPEIETVLLRMKNYICVVEKPDMIKQSRLA